MKQFILGSTLGRLAMSIRDKFEIMKAVLTKAEIVGSITNDQMATLLVTKLCSSNKTFIDVGAHIGSIISEVAYHDSTIKICAVEAIPDKVLKLRRKFPSVELHECAVGDSEGNISFYINTKKSGYSSLGKPIKEQESDTVEITVSLKKLDSLISYNDIDIIKIDVEGAELGVLRGSENIITTNNPVIMFESGPQQDNKLGYTKEDMWEFLTDHNYDILIPNRVAHNGPGLSKEGFIESHVYPRRTTNYIAVPIERRSEIKNRANNILNYNS